MLFCVYLLLKLWCHQESNRGHKDFQSFALPTELWHLFEFCECKGRSFFRTLQAFHEKKEEKVDFYHSISLFSAFNFQFSI